MIREVARYPHQNNKANEVQDGPSAIPPPNPVSALARVWQVHPSKDTTNTVYPAAFPQAPETRPHPAASTTRAAPT